jgi:hypothetical protein
MALWLWCVWTAARAQPEVEVEAEVEVERPLAIPQTAPPPPVVEQPRPRNPERIRARQTYRAEALSLRPYSELYQGTTWTRQVVWSPWGPGVATVARPFYVERTELGVFQGRERLDVPQTLGALGDLQAQEALEQRIRSTRSTGHVLYGLGALGIAGSIVGLIGLDHATSYEEAQVYGTMSLAGLGLGIGGFLVGTFPTGRAYRLQYDLDASQDLDELEARIEAHNRELAEKLGLPHKRD